MKRLTDYLKSHGKILIIGCLLVALIGLALLLYGGKNKVTSASSDDAVRSATEIKLMRILSEIDGVGKAEVMITEGNGGVEGVIIVCEGADNIMTRSDILNAAATALNVDKNNIAIYAMNK
ncbi:MAG: hypothetical protein NC033_00885 [Clostridiales bacterium]|nr:hypothetical protein [Clostridiales bacterium]